jgi:hypothetical protein
MRVRAVVRGVDARRFDAGSLQDFGQRHAGPFRTTDPAIGPLIAARGRREERAAVAAAFQHHAERLRFEFLFEIAKRDLERLVHLAVDREFPRVRILSRLRRIAVIADEEFRGRRGIVIEQRLRRFRDQRTVAEHDEIFVLARKVEKLRALLFRCGGRRRLRECSRHETRGHVLRKRNCPADNSAHRGDACAA